MNVAHHAAQLRSQSFQRSIGTFDLLGMRVTLVADQRGFADTLKGLAQGNAVPLGLADQVHAGTGQQFGIRWKGNRLWLHGGIHDHAAEIRGFCSTRAPRRGQALLQ